MFKNYSHLLMTAILDLSKLHVHNDKKYFAKQVGNI